MRKEQKLFLTGSLTVIIFGFLCSLVTAPLTETLTESVVFWFLVNLPQTIIVGGTAGLIAGLAASDNPFWVSFSSLIGWFSGAIGGQMLVPIYRTIGLSDLGALLLVIHIPIVTVMGILIGSMPSLMIWMWKRKKAT